MAARAVAVTGLGVVSPLGVGARAMWARLVRGDSGVGMLPDEACAGLPCRIGATVPDWDGSVWRRKRVPLFVEYALSAAHEALEDARWPVAGAAHVDGNTRTGVAIGCGVGSLHATSDTALAHASRGYRGVGPHFIPSILLNMAAAHVSIEWALRGPQFCPTTACAAGLSALVDGARTIRDGDADVMVCGATESAMHPIGIGGFARARALCTTHNDDPTRASRPFDAARNGFVMGEGAAVLVLEALEHAQARGARVYALVGGHGMSGDAHHITAPHESGAGALRAMAQCVQKSDAPLQQLYINAHATSTPLGDAAECSAIGRLVESGALAARTTRAPLVSSTKGATGHLLGAAGALESVVSVLALHERVVPPTLNLDTVDAACEGGERFTHVRGGARHEDALDGALCNSFGFGGVNVSVLFERPN